MSLKVDDEVNLYQSTDSRTLVFQTICQFSFRRIKFISFSSSHLTDDGYANIKLQRDFQTFASKTNTRDANLNFLYQTCRAMIIISYF